MVLAMLLMMVDWRDMGQRVNLFPMVLYLSSVQFVSYADFQVKPVDDYNVSVLRCSVCQSKHYPPYGMLCQWPVWEQYFCRRHLSDGTPKCLSCQRLKIQGIKHYTIDGVGGTFCAECLSLTPTTTAEQFDYLVASVHKFLSENGLKLGTIPAFLVPYVELKRFSRDSVPEFFTDLDKIHHQEHIIWRAQPINMVTRCEQIGDRFQPMTEVKNLQDSKLPAVAIPCGFPWVLTGCMIAREILYAWMLRQDWCFKTTPEVRSGMCQLIAYTWLKKQRKSRNEFQEKLVRNWMSISIEVAHNLGFEHARKAVERKGFKSTIDHIRKEKKFP